MKINSGHCLLANAVTAIVLLAYALPAPAYIDGGGKRITLPEILLEFRSVTVIQVEKADATKHAIRYKVVEQLKGKNKIADPKHQVDFEGAGPAILKQLKPGQTAVFFTDCYDKRSLTFLDGVWYWTSPIGDGWEQGPVRQDFNHVFTGTTLELADAVKKLLRGGDVIVRCQAKSGGSSIQFVRYSLREPHAKVLVREPAARNANDQPISNWVKGLQSQNPAVRLEAAQALAQIGPAAKEAVPALAKSLADKEEEVRSVTAFALGEIGPDAKGAVGNLAKALEDGDWFVSVAAAQALEKIGPDAKPAIGALSKALQPTGEVRDYRPIRSAAVAVALVKIDPGAKSTKSAISLLVDKLLNDDREDSNGTRVAGARALGQCGPAAQSAAGALAKRLKDKDAGVRIASALALMQIAPEKHVDQSVVTLTAILQDADVLNRVLAADALAHIGPRANVAAKALEAATKDPEAEVRKAATDALKVVASK
jgi:HEAT repeat protein